MEHGGRLTEMVIGLLAAKYGDAALSAVTQTRDSLRQCAIARFGDDNPFLEATA